MLKCSLISVIIVVASSLAFACPTFKTDYCCGLSLGVIQACQVKLHVEQVPIAGGVKYTFSGNSSIQGEYPADGQSHPFQGSFGAATMTGDAVTSCTDTSVSFNISKATIARGGVVAHGFYYDGVSIQPDGSLKPFQNCSFTTTTGSPVASGCGISFGEACVAR